MCRKKVQPPAASISFCSEIAGRRVEQKREEERERNEGTSSGGARRRLFLFPYNLAVVDGSFTKGQDARMPCMDRGEFVAGIPWEIVSSTF